MFLRIIQEKLTFFFFRNRSINYSANPDNILLLIGDFGWLSISLLGKTSFDSNRHCNRNSKNNS